MKRKDFTEPSLFVQNIFVCSQIQNDYEGSVDPKFRIHSTSKYFKDITNLQHKQSKEDSNKIIQPLACQQSQQYLLVQNRAGFDDFIENDFFQKEKSFRGHAIRKIQHMEESEKKQTKDLRQKEDWKRKDQKEAFERTSGKWQKNQLKHFSTKRQINEKCLKEKPSQRKIFLQFPDSQSSDGQQGHRTNPWRNSKDSNQGKQTSQRKINFNTSQLLRNSTLSRQSKSLSRVKLSAEGLNIQEAIQNKKKGVILTNFDSQSSLSEENADQFLFQSNLKKTKQPERRSSDLTSKHEKLKNIFLNNFDDSSSSGSQQKKQQQNSSFIHSFQAESVIPLTQHINIQELSHLISLDSLIFEPIPEHCVIQTLVKRYQEQQKSHLVYGLFDSRTFQSILKVKKVPQGFEIFTQKEIHHGQHKRLLCTKSKVGRSCALLCSNFFGTEYNCFKFDRHQQKFDVEKLERLATIKYQTNIFGFNGPRKMQAFIPVQHSIIKDEKNLQQIYDNQRKQNSKKVEKFVNKTPRWNSHISSFVLNFNGRATVSSVKNFIITKEGLQKKVSIEEEGNMVVFGKIQKNTFNLDIRHPFSLVQGLALALSSLDKKLGCE